MKDVDCLRAAALFSLSLLMTSATQAADYVITLPELLNHHWQHELVTYPFSADKDACATNSVQLTGPGGRLPVQLAGVELWPGTTSVKSAALAFVVEDLPALATQSFTVAYGPAPVAKAVGMPDLTVKRGADRVEATTSRFGVRLLLGEKAFDPAVAASNVPGPVLAMRLADGTWFGGSRLYGNTPIAGYSARLTEAGPVLLRVECLYRYADGRTNAITMQLNAQGNRVYYITHVPRGQPQDGWEISLSGLPPLAFQFMPEQVSLQPRTHAIKGWKEREIADYPAGLISNLTPWGDWVDEFTQTTLFLAFLDKRPASKSAGLMDSVKDPETAVDLDGAPASEPDGRELVIRRLDAGAWVTPGSGVSREQAQVPLIKAEDGTLSLRISNKAGARQWTIGENPYYLAKLVKVQNPTSTMQDDLEDLNVIKDMVLDWPATGPKHPSLLLDANDFAKAGERNPVALKRLQDAKTLRSDLGSYVFFDSMRHAAAVICQYDALIDSSLIAPQERRVLRAQMAYLAYRLASPANWSTAHGYNSGNPNMTVAHLVNQGLAASVLSDHPMAKEWVALPMASMNGWLDGIDDAGHWPESSHYARVSESKMVYFSIATHRAGLYPFLDDPRFKRMVLYYERTMTPPDPQRPMGPPGKQLLPRVTPPYGRGGNGESEGLGGMVAKATEKLDPGFSRILQWSYAGSQFSTQFGEDMFGYDQLMTDPALPKEQPDWRSELLPRVGALFRSGLGLPEENYLLMISKYATNPDGEIWPSETGAITTWFDHGKPLTRVFPAGSNYGYLNGLLLNRVMLATRYQRGKRVAGGYYGQESMTGFATLPPLDYIGERYRWTQPWNSYQPPPKVPDFPPVVREGVLPEGGVTWHRQALYVRDALPGGKNYLVLRDTLTGKQPTQWQFWTLSKELVPVDGKRIVREDDVDDIIAAGDDAKAVPENLPAALAAPVAMSGQHFVAIGQFGANLDYYVANPVDTPRHTIRHGFDAPIMGVVSGFRCEQDLLHLQLPGDGAYFVALVPRDAVEAVPSFATLGDGKVIKVSGPFGTDYAFLADSPTPATAEGAVFTGTVASVQDRTNGLYLALGAEGSVAYKAYGLAAPMAASLRIDADGITVTLPAQHTNCQVTVTAPEGLSGDPSVKGATVSARQKTDYQITMTADVSEARLTRRK